MSFNLCVSFNKNNMSKMVRGVLRFDMMAEGIFVLSILTQFWDLCLFNFPFFHNHLHPSKRQYAFTLCLLSDVFSYIKH